MPSSPRHIVFIAYDGVSLLDLSSPLEAFRVAAAFVPPQGRGAMYECTVVSARGGRVKTADGVKLSTKLVRSLARKPIDTLIVLGAFVVDDVTRDCA
jgi:transcriptional regulator GlxA family with amidase domain